jgi:hypothetical protein
MAARSRIYGGGAPRSHRRHRYKPDHTLLNQRLRFTTKSMPTHSNPSHLSKIWRHRAHLLSLANQPTQTTAVPTSRSWRPTGDNRLVMPAHHTPNPINLRAEGDNAFKIGGFIPEIGHWSTQTARHRDLADQHVAGEESPTSKSTPGCRDPKYDFFCPGEQTRLHWARIGGVVLCIRWWSAQHMARHGRRGGDSPVPRFIPGGGQQRNPIPLAPATTSGVRWSRSRKIAGKQLGSFRAQWIESTQHQERRSFLHPGPTDSPTEAWADGVRGWCAGPTPQRRKRARERGLGWRGRELVGRARKSGRGWDGPRWLTSAQHKKSLILLSFCSVLFSISFSHSKFKYSKLKFKLLI